MFKTLVCATAASFAFCMRAAFLFEFVRCYVRFDKLSVLSIGVHWCHIEREWNKDLSYALVPVT